MSNPSLLCVPYRFKTSTLYSQIPDSGLGDFTVTRSASNAATRVNAAGLIETVADNVPRLDYPVGGAVNGCPALLVEPSGTNLVQRSEEFNDAYWSKVRCTASPNQTTAPNGTLTADKLIMNNGESPTVNDMAGIYRSEAITSGAYRFSIFAKAAEFTGFKVRENAVSGSFMDVNLTNGAITNPDTAQFISPLAQNYGNGWYRISWTSPTITNLEKYSIRVGSTGNGVSGIFIWGAQVETSSVATSYIPTAASPVTRSAETISKTGISSLIGQTEGTIYAEFSVDFNNRNADILSINAGNSNNGFFMSLRDTSVVQLIVRTLGNNELIFQRVGAFSIGVNKLAMAYKNGDFAICLNGTAVQTNTNNIAMPSVSIDKISLDDSALYVLDRQLRIRAAAIYPTRLTNAQLQSLTQ